MFSRPRVIKLTRHKANQTTLSSSLFLKRRIFLWLQLLLTSYFRLPHCLRWSLLFAFDIANQFCKSFFVCHCQSLRVELQFRILLQLQSCSGSFYLLLVGSRFVAGVLPFCNRRSPNSTASSNTNKLSAHRHRLSIVVSSIDVNLLFTTSCHLRATKRLFLFQWNVIVDSFSFVQPVVVEG